jgi:hypothetical protein
VVAGQEKAALTDSVCQRLLPDSLTASPGPGVVLRMDGYLRGWPWSEQRERFQRLVLELPADAVGRVTDVGRDAVPAYYAEWTTDMLPCASGPTAHGTVRLRQVLGLLWVRLDVTVPAGTTMDLVDGRRRHRGERRMRATLWVRRSPPAT